MLVGDGGKCSSFFVVPTAVKCGLNFERRWHHGLPIVLAVVSFVNSNYTKVL